MIKHTELEFFDKATRGIIIIMNMHNIFKRRKLTMGKRYSTKLIFEKGKL
jgi:hypothetical protein